jgi:hypothetical protein
MRTQRAEAYPSFVGDVVINRPSAAPTTKKVPIHKSRVVRLDLLDGVPVHVDVVELMAILDCFRFWLCVTGCPCNATVQASSLILGDGAFGVGTRLAVH